MASVLVSEVERDVRRLLTTLVERQGHEAIVLGPDVAAPPRADVLLVDPLSPSSMEHVRLVRARHPQLPLVCMGPLPAELGPIGDGPVFFLPKPFPPERLAAMLERALTHAGSPVQGRRVVTAIVEGPGRNGARDERTRRFEARLPPVAVRDPRNG